MTPGAMTPTTPHGTPGHSTPLLTPGGSTPVGVKAMTMATPTPGQHLLKFIKICYSNLLII